MKSVRFAALVFAALVTLGAASFAEDTSRPEWALVIHGGPHASFSDQWHWRWNYSNGD